MNSKEYKIESFIRFPFNLQIKQHIFFPEKNGQAVCFIIKSQITIIKSQKNHKKNKTKNTNCLSRNMFRFVMKLFKVKLKICEQHLDSIGLQLIFLSQLWLRKKNRALPLNPKCHSRKSPLTLNNFYLDICKIGIYLSFVFLLFEIWALFEFRLFAIWNFLFIQIRLLTFRY